VVSCASGSPFCAGRSRSAACSVARYASGVRSLSLRRCRLHWCAGWSLQSAATSGPRFWRRLGDEYKERRSSPFVSLCDGCHSYVECHGWPVWNADQIIARIKRRLEQCRGRKA
jgi:hypothetical protein